MTLLAGAAISLLVACGGGGGGGSDSPAVTPPPVSTGVSTFDMANAPAKLSAWRMVQSNGAKLTLNTGVVPYDLNAALFTDYAYKLRAFYVPAGKQITYKADGILEFPVGSAIMKTFYYPKATGTTTTHIGVARQTQSTQGADIDLASHHLVETRVLVLQANGKWAGIPYVWDADQKDATLTIGGKDVDLELVASTGNEKFSYNVPGAGACVQCHAWQSAGGDASGTVGSLPIGPKARNLNRSYAYGAGNTQNQLSYLNAQGLMSGFTGLATAPINADYRDTSQTLEERAKAYLDGNCAHCHSSRGAAFQSGLMLDVGTIGTTSPSTSMWGVCKKPLAYSSQEPSRRYDIEPGQAIASILLYRLSHTETSEIMPTIGRKVNHTEGIAVVRDWINGLTLLACK